MAGVAEINGQCIYKSSDNGETWTALPKEKGMYPLQADISSNGKMYITYSDNCGPNLSPEMEKYMLMIWRQVRFQTLLPL